jgi:ABC-type nitrate/sulfonate/bicarbonate transport system substrate-binding protein
LANSTLIAHALARGDAEMGTLNPQTMWTAIAKGAKARTFMQGIPTVSLSMAKAEIKTCANLDGKRVAFAAATGMSPAQFDLYVKQNCPNIKPTRVVIVESDARVAALLKGEIDSSQLPLQNVLQLERLAPGKFVRLIDYVKEYPNLLTGVLNVRQSWVKQNPEIVKDFLRALLNAHRRINANPQLLYDEAVKRLNMTPADAKEACAADLQYAMWDVNGGVTKQNIEATLTFLAQINQVASTLKADDVADLSYLNAVLDEIGRK